MFCNYHSHNIDLTFEEQPHNMLLVARIIVVTSVVTKHILWASDKLLSRCSQSILEANLHGCTYVANWNPVVQARKFSVDNLMYNHTPIKTNLKL